MPSDRRKILKAIKREGQKIRDPHARRVYLRAAVQTGLVESNLSNPSGGDADSAGWRQERASLYADPTNIKASARRFRQEFQQQYQPGEKSYDVAAQVQRPAAQYRGRYKDAAPQAAQILRGVKGMAPNTREGSSSSETTTTSYRSTPGTDYSTERRDAKLAYLQDSHNPDALLNLGLTLKGLKDTPGTSSKVVKRSSSSSSPGATRTGSALVDAVKSEADQINKAQVSYQWGGGHGGKQARGSKITPLDCSGAVSRVLGVNPRVSGEFAKWGKPGRGKVTVYSNNHHVLMEINGHFWGTSASNPGGGAGWIPRSKIPPGYLKNFTARHA